MKTLKHLQWLMSSRPLGCRAEVQPPFQDMGDSDPVGVGWGGLWWAGGSVGGRGGLSREARRLADAAVWL